MLPLGHVAYTWAGLAWLQSRGRAAGVDFRAAAVAALLPDLVDKPLSLTLLSETGTSQGPAHTLLAQAALSLATARCQPGWLPYALICNGHLLADQMWKYPRTLLFPFSGRLDSWKFMGSPAAMLSAYAEIVTRPAILAVEAVGLALLGWVVHRGRLYRRERLARLLRRGTIELGKRGE
ncbi:MAG: metal-dependent hydrolase [Anaerolineae bacterium]